MNLIHYTILRGIEANIECNGKPQNKSLSCWVFAGWRWWDVIDGNKKFERNFCGFRCEICEKDSEKFRMNQLEKFLSVESSQLPVRSYCQPKPKSCLSPQNKWLLLSPSCLAVDHKSIKKRSCIIHGVIYRWMSILCFYLFAMKNKNIPKNIARIIKNKSMNEIWSSHGFYSLKSDKFPDNIETDFVVKVKRNLWFWSIHV